MSIYKVTGYVMTPKVAMTRRYMKLNSRAIESFV